jgi:hypothetical protein
MAASKTLEAIRDFLNCVVEGAPPSKSDLAIVLDVLALSYHKAPEGEPADTQAEPPSGRYTELYRQLENRFAYFRYYNAADGSEVHDGKLLTGDPVDDLADIVGDLQEVVWRADNLGLDDAHWHFRYLYKNHWGWHLRGLALYLWRKGLDA